MLGVNGPLPSNLCCIFSLVSGTQCNLITRERTSTMKKLARRSRRMRSYRIYRMLTMPEVLLQVGRYIFNDSLSVGDSCALFCRLREQFPNSVITSRYQVFPLKPTGCNLIRPLLGKNPFVHHWLQSLHSFPFFSAKIKGLFDVIHAE